MADVKIKTFVKFLTSEQQISFFCFANLVVLNWEGHFLDSDIFNQSNIQHTFISHSEQFFLSLYSAEKGYLVSSNLPLQISKNIANQASTH